jgi:uncharacterized protein YacL
MGRDLLKVGFVVLTVSLLLALGPAGGAELGFWLAAGINAVLGLLLGLAGLSLAVLLERAELRTLLGGLAGLGAGGLAGWIFVRFFSFAGVPAFAGPAAYLMLVFLGTLVGASRGRKFSLQKLRGALQQESAPGNDNILDTSVIIDGRIADVCETGFLDGRLVVPQFILTELQAVADSSDNLKRNRGRKGLDVLQRLQRHPDLDVVLLEQDYPGIREVDQKLVAMAKDLRGKLVTMDFNLNQVAQLHGIQVLNINDLANALKPVVLPGETIHVFILKQGKEERQGVAYLDDGTMVVVDDARNAVGSTIPVTITSVLQTTVGKMFFARYDVPEGNSQRRSPQRQPRSGERG